jgi:hypothetical protein
LNVLLQLGITVGAIFLMLALWLLVQALVRRDLPSSARERDVLACRGCATHSCSGCSLDTQGDN